MKKYYTLTIILIILLLIASTATYILFNKQPQNTQEQETEAQREEQIRSVQETYEQEIPSLINEYRSWDIDVVSETEITSLRDQLLELRVPTLYKDLHLDFVIGLDILYQGKINNNKSLVTKGTQQIERAINTMNQ